MQGICRRGSSIQFRLVPKLILIRYLNLPNLILMRNLNLILLLILNSNRGTLNPKSSKLDCRLDIAAKHPGRTSGKWVTHPLGTLVPGHLGPYGRSAPDLGCFRVLKGYGGYWTALRTRAVVQLRAFHLPFSLL